MKVSVSKKGIIIGVVGAVLTLSIVGSTYLLGFGRVKNPGFCTLCHETHYDYKEYAVKDIKSMGMPRGVLVGCVECHPSPFLEFKESDHYKTEEAQYKPGCTNCHRPHSIGQFAGYMYLALSPWEGVMESLIKDAKAWERDIRPRMAKKAREMFLREDSNPCRGCHIKAGFRFDRDLGPHKIMAKEKMTCIECHFNLVHKEVPWPEMEAKKKRLGVD